MPLLPICPPALHVVAPVHGFLCRPAVSIAQVKTIPPLLHGQAPLLSALLAPSQLLSPYVAAGQRPIRLQPSQAASF